MFHNELKCYFRSYNEFAKIYLKIIDSLRNGAYFNQLEISTEKYCWSILISCCSLKLPHQAHFLAKHALCAVLNCVKLMGIISRFSEFLLFLSWPKGRKRQIYNYNHIHWAYVTVPYFSHNDTLYVQVISHKYCGPAVKSWA